MLRNGRELEAWKDLEADSGRGDRLEELGMIVRGEGKQ
jgi:hypothetical protein